MVIWHNGEFYESDQNAIAATSAGLTLGWGVFTTIGVQYGHPFALQRHLARLRHDAASTDIEIAYTDSNIQDALTGVLRDNKIDDGIARITLTRRADGRWNSESGSDLTIIAAPRTPLPLSGLRVMLSPYRLDARRPLAGIKTTSYLEHQWIWREAHERGFDEAIFCNSQSILCEGARSNLFWVRNGDLSTPALSSGCLPGIARTLICEWAFGMGITVREGAFSLQELLAADEVFLTSAASGPRAVEVFNDGTAENGEEYSFASPGDVTRQLQERWEVEVQAGGTTTEF